MRFVICRFLINRVLIQSAHYIILVAYVLYVADVSYLHSNGDSFIMADSPERSNCAVDGLDLEISKKGEQHFVPLVEDVSDWLSQTFKREITTENYLDELDDGSLMCELAKKIQNTSEDYCVKRKGVKATIDKEKPLPKFEYKIHANARKQSFQARENAANFIRYFKA